MNAVKDGATIHVRTVSGFNDYAHVWGLAKRISEVYPVATLEQARRAIYARDAQVMRTLERLTEVGSKRDDNLHGESRRARGLGREDKTYGREAQDVEVWRKCYEMADRGEPVNELLCYYAAAAVWCGAVVRSWDL